LVMYYPASNAIEINVMIIYFDFTSLYLLNGKTLMVTYALLQRPVQQLSAMFSLPPTDSNKNFY
jgi:hypothetical protein